MKYDLIAIDLAKNVFQFAALNGNKVLVNQKVNRAKLITLLTQAEPTTVVMEACATAHFWGRKCIEAGHQPKLIPAQYVKPFRRGNKNDANDALAIAEASVRPRILPVPVKSQDQQVMQMWHRRRGLVVRQRTQSVSQTRAFAAELGLISPKGRTAIMRAIPCWLEDAENGLSVSAREWLADMWEQIRTMDEKIADFDQRLKQWASDCPLCRQLQTLRGVGPVVATALVAAVHDGSGFRNGRAMAAWLGLVPGHAASGGKHQELGMTKRGNPQLRCLIIHGARAAIRHLGERSDPVSKWARGVVERRGKHKAIVAMANKTVRMAWAMLQSGEAYRYA